METSTNERRAGEAVVTACASCGRKNRILEARLGDDPRCGICKEPIFPRRPVSAGDATFAEVVERSPIPVLVDFWAPWCGPCRAVAPMLDDLAAARGGRLKVVKVNVDDSPATAARFAVQAIPTMIVFRAGRPIEQVRGALPKPALEARLAALGL